MILLGKMWMGTELTTTQVGYGETPEQALPEDTEEWDYTTWSPSIETVTGDATYQAKRDKQTYTVTFDTAGGSNIDSQTLEYGTEIIEPSSPEKEGYNFVNWVLDGESTSIEWPYTLKGDVTLVATWNETVPYTTYLESLFDNYFFDPYSFIPEAMHPGYNLG